MKIIVLLYISKIPVGTKPHVHEPHVISAPVSAHGDDVQSLASFYVSYIDKAGVNSNWNQSIQEAILINRSKMEKRFK